MAVILIGSTGNGKSTLGNFLVNPEKEHIFGEQQTFKTARTNLPQTQLVESASFKVKDTDSSISVIDTPGIFEDEDKDIEHMINIIRVLHSVGEVRACILVVKFSSKVDTPYKSSIKYYSKLLPGLFETNLIVVMTDYACDERSKNLRLLQGIDEEQIKKNIFTEIVTLCGVSRTPKLYTIDCLPMSKEEFGVNLQTRDDIISQIFTFNSVSTKDLKVAKTDPIIAADKLSIAQLEGEVSAFDVSLEKATVNAYSAHAQVEQVSKKIRNLKVDVENVGDELGLLNTSELVEAESWSIDIRWRWFKILSRSFEVTSKWPIRDVKYWTNGKCRWTRQEKVTDYSVQGRVKSKCNRGLHAKVTVEVFMSDKHGEDISILQNDLDNKRESLANAENELAKSQQMHTQFSNEIDSLKKDIKGRRTKIEKLSSDYLTMEECLERFPVGNSK